MASIKSPHIISAVNGIKIPFQPGHVNIMHRFETPENKVFIKSTSLVAERDSEAAMDLGQPEPAAAEPVAEPVADAKPKAKVAKKAVHRTVALPDVNNDGGIAI